MFGSTGGKEPSSPSASAGGAAGSAADAAHAGAVSSGGQGATAGHGGIMRDSLDGSQKSSLAVRDAPGAGLVLWAESAAGAMELERPYTHSTSLDGGFLYRDSSSPANCSVASQLPNHRQLSLTGSSSRLEGRHVGCRFMYDVQYCSHSVLSL